MKLKGKLSVCRQLFATFFKIGAFTIGGGYAMVPLIERDVVDKKHWLEPGDMLDIIAIAESTPGPIAINTATFVGTRVAGFWGAFSATLGTVLPSFIIISTLAVVLGKFIHLQPVAFAFNGIRAGVIALIVKALVNMAKSCPKNIFSLVIASAAFLVVTFTGVNVLYVIIAGALIGLACGIYAKEVKK